MVVIKL